MNSECEQPLNLIAPISLNLNHFYMALLAYLIISVAIGFFLGDKRQIGFGWGIFFCLVFSPLIGTFIILTSRSKHKPKVELTTASTTLFFSLSALFLVFAAAVTSIFIDGMLDSSILDYEFSGNEGLFLGLSLPLFIGFVGVSVFFLSKIIHETKWVLLAFLGGMYLTNPSFDDFTAFMDKTKAYRNPEIYFHRRTANFLLCSTYSYKTFKKDETFVYIGILGNFILLDHN